jgi:tellurite resistance protein TerC
MPISSASQWAILGTVVIVALAADLAIFHREAHEVKLREALLESAGWIGLALAFNAWIYFSRGQGAGLDFLTAYVLEKSMSADNILVFILIFASLGVPAKSQHTVLFYGVAGALAMRGLFVWGGIALLQRFHAVLFVFGAILLIAGLRMLFARPGVTRQGPNLIVQIARRIAPVADHFDGEKLWVRENGRAKMTALFVALIAVEAMDLIFAVDSVPAVLAITRDPFIAYSSNAFAILGLRALYFALSGALARLRYLHQGLAVILIFVACKMLASDRLPISSGLSLGIIGGILALTVAASLGTRERTQPPRPA